MSLEFLPLPSSPTFLLVAPALPVLNRPSPIFAVGFWSSQHRFSAMIATQQRNANVRLLACLIVEDDTDDSDYRFLVDGQHVKCVSTAPGAFRGAEDDRTFEPILLNELFPAFPPGHWNHGHAARDPETGKAASVRTERAQFAEVKNLWHPVTLNELDFTRQDRVKQRVHVSTHPGVEGGKPVLVKLAVWPWEIPFMEVETAAYQWIRDSGIGPEFLGHLTGGRDGRVVGFVAEWVEGARAAGSGETLTAAGRLWAGCTSSVSSWAISTDTTFSCGMDMM